MNRRNEKVHFYNKIRASQILHGPKAHMTQEGVDLMLCTLIENPTRPRGVLDCVSFQAIEDYRGQLAAEVPGLVHA